MAILDASAATLSSGIEPVDATASDASTQDPTTPKVNNGSNNERPNIAEQKSLRPRLPSASVELPPKRDTNYWLNLGTQALNEDFLTTPEGTSAFDYFNKVLIMSPDNAAAKQGLKDIESRYIIFAQTSVNVGDYQAALRYLRRAEMVNPQSSVVWQALQKVQALDNQSNERAQDAKVVQKVVKQEANTTQDEASASDASNNKDHQKAEVAETLYFAPIQTLAESVVSNNDGVQKQTLLVPPEAMKKRAVQLRQYLRKLAKQIESVDARLIIQAPRDSDIRWVYAQLNQTSEDYRIRANIRHKAPITIYATYRNASTATQLSVFE